MIHPIVKNDLTVLGHSPPTRQIRAAFSESTISVYQAFSSEIADAAVRRQTFVPPFSRARMTWIKPSFAWMMYRSGWATKPGQERVLRVELRRTGFDWALDHACLTSFDRIGFRDEAVWRDALRASPVRVQWDPERTLRLEELRWRTIQIGIGLPAMDAYCDEWIAGIEDVTPTLASIVDAVDHGATASDALSALPPEVEYPVSMVVGARIGASIQPLAFDDVERP